MAIINSNRDLDTTIITATAAILGLLVTFGFMYLHIRFPKNTLLSPEIAMALINLPGLFISYSLGKKIGAVQNEMEQEISKAKEKEKATE